MKEKGSISLYTIEEDVVCLKCGNKGAIQHYGAYYPSGVGKLADEMKVYEDVRNKPYMSHAMGFGGTIPHKCLNCNNTGLIDFGGLEGYHQAFQSLKKKEKTEKKSLYVIEGKKRKESDANGDV